jgi:hypothetical protein
MGTRLLSETAAAHGTFVAGVITVFVKATACLRIQSFIFLHFFTFTDEEGTDESQKGNTP